MDWYSWLSQTNLDPYLVYDYGRAFSHNEIQRSDLNYFTHEFLRSIGVSVAKHRLEILKLARKKRIGACPFSKLMSAITKTRLLLSKRLGKCVSFKRSVQMPSPNPDPFRPQWPSINLRKSMGFDENTEDKVPKTKMKSGPLDRRVHESYTSPKKVSSISGPLDRKVQENLLAMYSSPGDTSIGPNGPWPLDEVDYSPRIWVPYDMVQTGGQGVAMSSLWSLMFQNIKPT